MNINLEVPYQIEALSLHLGVTPKTLLTTLAHWFTEPMEGTGLLVHTRRNPRPKKRKLATAIAKYAVAQKLSRAVAMERMIERSVTAQR